MKPSLRIYLVTHHDGWLTGILMRRKGCFDSPPPAAYGETEAEVLSRIDHQMAAFEATGQDDLERYLWTEDFQTARVRLDVFPGSTIEQQSVVGARRIPLRLTYCWCPLEGAGYRVLLPRFGWSLILESLDTAAEVLRSAISGALLGEAARWAFDFRAEGEEYVKAWSPPRLLDWEAGALDGEDDELPTVRSVCDELVERAARHKLPIVVGGGGPSDLVEAHAALLRREPPASLLLVGGPGVGKTTLVHRIARYLARWRREEKTRHVPRLWSTNADRIIAGMMYLGMWQARCLELVRELAGEGDYLYVDRLWALLQPQPDGDSIGGLLASAGGLMGSGTQAISLIAECDQAELERLRQHHPSLLEGFQVIRVGEASPAEMGGLLALYLGRRSPGARIEARGMRSLVRHLGAFQRDQRFPGKGFRFVDWLVQQGAVPTGRPLCEADVTRSYQRWSGLPIELISDEHPAAAADIAARLAERVIGQDEACASCGQVLARLKAGVNDPDRPWGSLLFVGPTGVGKTELAKALAAWLFGGAERGAQPALIRLDMSEYASPGSSRRLLQIGAGISSLAERVRQRPLCLVLLDEIEKAAPEVLDLLLGVLGEGRLTDTSGRLVDFRTALIVMTSNLGAGGAAAIGFGGTGGPAADSYHRAVRDAFRPELFNRLDQVIAFRPLSPASLDRIVLLELDAAGRRAGFRRRNLRLVVDEAGRALLAARGHDPAYGARPLKRVIEALVVTPVAVYLARHPELSGHPVERHLRLVPTADGARLRVVEVGASTVK